MPVSKLAEIKTRNTVYVSEGLPIFNSSFNIVLSDQDLARRLAKHAKGKRHILASKLENKTDEIEVKVRVVKIAYQK